MKVTAAGGSRKGPQRKQNEDAWRIYQDQSMVHRAARGALFAVADGVGGTGAGRYASWHVVDGLSFFFNVPADRFDPGNTMKEIIVGCHNTLNRLAKEDKAYTMAATTLALLYVAPKRTKGYMLSIGDSGAFVLHRGNWLQLNQDHRDERGKVTSSIGMGRKLQISYRGLRFNDGDRFLLCSDGVREELPEPELAQRLAEDVHPQVIVDSMLAEAESLGGRDNMTAVVVVFGDCPDPPPDPDDDF